MPIYEFKCPKCQRVFEEMVHFSEMHSEEPCPDCGTPSPKLISQTSFLLKGGGWYVSDYGYRKGVSEDGSSASSGSSQDQVKSDGQAGKSGSSATDTGGKTEAGKPESKPSTASAQPATKPAASGSGKTATGAA